jgi:prepilin-type N-terminal cleavage/methylation domain-containing protein
MAGHESQRMAFPMGFLNLIAEGESAMNKHWKGFSLIELLIVVAIILIIAAIAIPNLLRSRMAANEASAVGSLRTINTAEVTYSTTYGTGFAPLTNLGGANPCVAVAATSCLLDSVLSGGTKSGYLLTTLAPAALGTIAAPNVIYSANAVPVVVGQSGQRSFCTDQSGVIRNDPTGAVPANPCNTSGLNPIQ